MSAHDVPILIFAFLSRSRSVTRWQFAVQLFLFLSPQMGISFPRFNQAACGAYTQQDSAHTEALTPKVKQEENSFLQGSNSRLTADGVRAIRQDGGKDGCGKIQNNPDREKRKHLFWSIWSLGPG